MHNRLSDGRNAGTFSDPRDSSGTLCLFQHRTAPRYARYIINSGYLYHLNNLTTTYQRLNFALKKLQHLKPCISEPDLRNKIPMLFLTTHKRDNNRIRGVYRVDPGWIWGRLWLADPGTGF